MSHPERTRPRYPVFIPSKGRADNCFTADVLQGDGVPFRLVVEEAEFEQYRARYPGAIIVCPVADGKGVVPVRRWMQELSITEGFGRHWQIDDNIRVFRRMWKGKRLPVHAGIALRCAEDFTDRYTNVGITGLNYEMFLPRQEHRPFYLNTKCYSCCLISNEMPYRHRGRYNEDTDLCLQVLAGGLCTVQINAFMIQKIRTMNLSGGNTDALDYFTDGRLRMARALERVWPYVVSVDRRFQRPQHVVRDHWHGFDTPLQRRDDFDFDALAKVDEYGLELIQVADEVRSASLREMLSESRHTPGVESPPLA